MRIVVVGEKLANFLFKLIEISNDLFCETLFLKHLKKEIDERDIVVIDSDLIDEVPEGSCNLIISVVSHLNYQKKFQNEETVNFSSLASISEIIRRHRLFKQCAIFEDDVSLGVFKVAKKIANTDATILITGETGTGKEILARYIHENSSRRQKKFIALNCAAVPETLIESELFGHERGAFTNAIFKRIGRFEEADGGTILLDEISETSPIFQAKLLRVLQEKEITPIGSNQNKKIDVRIIATSNKNLNEEVAARRFREDLFYRLNVIPIFFPKLNDRPRDIVALAVHFCDKYSNFKKSLSREFLKKLQGRVWNGNVRELENFIHRAVLLSSEDIINDEDSIFMFSNFISGEQEARGELKQKLREAVKL